jgi:hypothetical protein
MASNVSGLCGNLVSVFETRKSGDLTWTKGCVGLPQYSSLVRGTAVDCGLGLGEGFQFE